MKEVLLNELYEKKLNLDTETLKHSCSKLNDIILNYDKKYKDDVGGLKCLSQSSQLWKVYNTFLFPLEGFHDLFNSIKETFYEANPSNNKKYYIQCWLNWYLKDEYIDWHTHAQTPNCEFMSGYYCVDAEPSYTTYKFDNYNFDYINKNDYVVFTKMNKTYNGNKHRTWPWPYENRPRITIAFEIIHQEGIPLYFEDQMFNHWVPI